MDFGKRTIYMIIVIALLASVTMMSGVRPTTASAADPGAKPQDVEYWRYRTNGNAHPPVALPDGKVFAATDNGWIIIIGDDGVPAFQKNTYAEMAAPTVAADGSVWIAASSARLYRYDQSGSGGAVTAFYYQNKVNDLLPTKAVVDGKGIVYFGYDHKVLSWNDKDRKQAVAALPGDVSVRGLAAGDDRVYVKGSDGETYMVQGGTAASISDVTDEIAALLETDATAGARLGGGGAVRASGAYLIAAGPNRPVSISYADKSIALTQDKRLRLPGKLKLSKPVAVRYSVDNPGVAKVNELGVVSPLAAGKTNIVIEADTPGYAGSLSIPLTVKKSAFAKKAVYETKKVKIGSRTYTVNLLTIPTGMPVTAGIAQRKVGQVQPLADLAVSYKADVAINGTFFDAYTAVQEPYGTIIADGQIAHMGNYGTTVGFTWDGRVLMDKLRPRVRGTTNGLEDGRNSWYVYFINRTPAKGASSAVMLTPLRGTRIGFAYGKYVAVSKGVVTKMGSNYNAPIPQDGYVLVFAGKEEQQASRFAVGMKVGYTVQMNDDSGKELPDWYEVHTAIGAGPRLVKNGKLAVDPEAEGFSSDKIITNAGMRSGIMVKKDGTVALATVSGATVKQWAEIMLQLGAWQAMNLDGGASSGLYANGKAVVPPGRQISNALLFGQALRW